MLKIGSSNRRVPLSSSLRSAFNNCNGVSLTLNVPVSFVSASSTSTFVALAGTSPTRASCPSNFFPVIASCGGRFFSASGGQGQCPWTPWRWHVGLAPHTPVPHHAFPAITEPHSAPSEPHFAGGRFWQLQACRGRPRCKSGLTPAQRPLSLRWGLWAGQPSKRLDQHKGNTRARPLATATATKANGDRSDHKPDRRRRKTHP